VGARGMSDMLEDLPRDETGEREVKEVPGITVGEVTVGVSNSNSSREGLERKAEDDLSKLGPGVARGVELGSLVPGPSKTLLLPASDSSKESSVPVRLAIRSSSAPELDGPQSGESGRRKAGICKSRGHTC